MMKRPESEAENAKVIKQLLAMNQAKLLEYIEINRSWYSNWGVLSSITNTVLIVISEMFLELSKQPPIDISNPRYPKFKLVNSLAEKYIYDVQRVLCEDGWLCKTFDEISNLPLEEQVEHISNEIQRHEVLEGSRYKVASLATAVLILKIGPKQFCGCV
jgi:hypothetical protein